MNDIPLSSKTFDWMEFAQHEHVPLAVLGNRTASIAPDELWKGMHLRLSAYVLTEQLPPQTYAMTVPLPQTWVDRLKWWARDRRLVGGQVPILAWWAYRWPPRPKAWPVTIELKPFYAYPDASIPYEKGGAPVRMYRIEE